MRTARLARRRAASGEQPEFLKCVVERTGTGGAVGVGANGAGEQFHGGVHVGDAFRRGDGERHAATVVLSGALLREEPRPATRQSECFRG